MDEAINDIVILDKVKKLFNLKGDVQVAYFLGITPSAVSQIRNNLISLGFFQRIKLVDMLVAITVTDGFDSFAPEEIIKISLFKDVLAAICLDNIEKKLQQLQSNANSNVSGILDREQCDARLIDMFKNYFGFKTDTDLGDFIGLKKAAISNIRKGKAGIGEIARIRMLGKVDNNFDSISYEEFIQSNDRLEKLIDYLSTKKALININKDKLSRNSSVTTESRSF